MSDLKVTYKLVEKNNYGEEEEVDKEMSEVIEKTESVFMFTRNKLIPVWTKMLLFNSNMIKKMDKVIKHINNSDE